jgi:hypothetical protein
MNVRTVSRVLLCALATIVSAALESVAIAQASSANTISLQAKLSGVPDGTVNLSVQFYDAPTGGNAVGGAITVNGAAVVGGVVSVPLVIDPVVLNGGSRWAGLKVNAGAELSPRVFLTAVPYAMQTRGLFVDASLRVGIGTNNPQQRCVVGTTTSEANRLTFGIDEALTIGTSNRNPSARSALLFETGNRTAAAIIAEKQNGGSNEDNWLRFFTVRDGEFALERMTINTFGFLGIGNTNPKSRLVVGTTQQSINRLPAMDEAIVVGTRNSAADTRVGLVFETVDRTGGAIIVEKRAGGGVEDHRMRFYLNQDGEVNARLCMSIYENGRVQVPVLQITGGSDIAEPASVTPTPDIPVPQPGMVMAIDRDRDGKLTPCSQPYDKAVAGVISGANGLQPGLVLKAEGQPHADGEYPLAMTGRVWVLCDANQSPIRRGDRITTSSTPGHGMAASDDVQSPGAVIGKAMTELQNGKGLVLVLVNLQ